MQLGWWINDKIIVTEVEYCKPPRVLWLSELGKQVSCSTPWYGSLREINPISYIDKYLMLLLIYRPTMNYLTVLDTSKMSICICFRQYLELLAECAETQPTLIPSPPVTKPLLFFPHKQGGVLSQHINSASLLMCLKTTIKTWHQYQEATLSLLTHTDTRSLTDSRTPYRAAVCGRGELLIMSVRRQPLRVWRAYRKHCSWYDTS